MCSMMLLLLLDTEAMISNEKITHENVIKACVENVWKPCTKHIFQRWFCILPLAHYMTWYCKIRP